MLAYIRATKVYNVIKSMLIAVYSVAIPRLSSFVGTENYCAYKKLFTNLWCGVSLLLLPAGIGLFCMAEEVILLIGGTQFCGRFRFRILSLALIAAVFGGLLTACLNVTIGKESINLKATIISAGINFVLNLICIPLLAQTGTALSILIAELFVTIYCFMKTDNRQQYFDSKAIILNIWQAGIAISLMVVYIALIKHFIAAFVLRTIISICGSVLIYGLVLVLLGNSYLKNILRRGH